jgi:type IV secretory pathway TrbL component
MDILVVLKGEEVKLQRQLKGIQGAIAALNGSRHTSSHASIVSNQGVSRKRVMSAAARAKISKATKERWAKYRAEKAKKAK